MAHTKYFNPLPLSSIPTPTYGTHLSLSLLPLPFFFSPSPPTLSAPPGAHPPLCRPYSPLSFLCRRPRAGQGCVGLLPTPPASASRVWPAVVRRRASAAAAACGAAAAARGAAAVELWRHRICSGGSSGGAPPPHLRPGTPPLLLPL
jgi:hypothetical protein